MSELEVLRMLRSQGVVSASEFVQLASELHAKQDAEFEEVRSELASLRASPLASVQASPTRASSSSAANRRAHVSDDEDSEMLVDEEGGQYQPPSSPLLVCCHQVRREALVAVMRPPAAREVSLQCYRCSPTAPSPINQIHL